MEKITSIEEYRKKKELRGRLLGVWMAHRQARVEELRKKILAHSKKGRE